MKTKLTDFMQHLYHEIDDEGRAEEYLDKDYDQLVNDLKESARLRNLVAHANWETTNEEGYTFVKLKMSKKGMHQEYVQFTEESLTKIIELIIKTKNNLYEFWEHRNDVLYER